VPFYSVRFLRCHPVPYFDRIEYRIVIVLLSIESALLLGKDSKRVRYMLEEISTCVFFLSDVREKIKLKSKAIPVTDLGGL
jgi:hypothetical protein